MQFISRRIRAPFFGFWLFSYKYQRRSVREPTLEATWELPTWLAVAIREPTLLFVTERGFIVWPGRWRFDVVVWK